VGEEALRVRVIEASGCLGQCELSVVNLIWCQAVKGLMGTLGAVEHGPLRQSPPEFQSKIKRSQIQVPAHELQKLDILI
jgi:hypothetical protein